MPAPSGSDVNDFMNAIFNGKTDRVAAVLQARADAANWRSITGTPMIIYAVSSKQPAILRMLLAAGAEVDAPIGGSKMTALQLAADRGETACIAPLLAHGAALRMETREGRIVDISGEVKQEHPAIAVLLRAEELRRSAVRLRHHEKRAQHRETAQKFKLKGPAS